MPTCPVVTDPLDAERMAAPSNSVPLPRGVSRDTLMNLAQAGRIRPSPDGRALPPAVLARWIGRGVVLRDGQRLRLRAVCQAGQWVTNVRSIDEFFAAQADARMACEAGGRR